LDWRSPNNWNPRSAKVFDSTDIYIVTSHAVERWTQRVNPFETDWRIVSGKIEDLARQSEIILESGSLRYLRHRDLQLVFPCHKSGGKFIITSTLTWQIFEKEHGEWRVNPVKL
jgi:hypothetical protein